MTRLFHASGTGVLQAFIYTGNYSENKPGGGESLQIALCDDEITNHETVRELIRQYKQIHSDRTLSLSSFASGKELINHVDEHGCFDLYILDCIMPEMNGIELGAALRTRDDTDS